ncbi:MAG: hypothetical protein H7A35_08310 [Planctomycetales bacterium]|nr:hypothetical protein [bacterium]UNM06888.1 MAG: hypothetical protein H7A35_08310 [Planctomycetales bacterium]
MARTYCECKACGYLVPVESGECSNCGELRQPGTSKAVDQQPVLRVPGEDIADNTPVVPANPASSGAVDELLLDEIRNLRRMQDRQGRSILRWMKLQSLILALTGLFVTIIIFLCYLAITGPIG